MEASHRGRLGILLEQPAEIEDVVRDQHAAWPEVIDGPPGVLVVAALVGVHEDHVERAARRQRGERDERVAQHHLGAILEARRAQVVARDRRVLFGDLEAVEPPARSQRASQVDPREPRERADLDDSRSLHPAEQPPEERAFVRAHLDPRDPVQLVRAERRVERRIVRRMQPREVLEDRGRCVRLPSAGGGVGHRARIGQPRSEGRRYPAFVRVTSPPPPPPPGPNARFGNYTIVERIAVGGMAEVFRAAEPRTVGEARTVVIKRMLATLATEAPARAMFEAEARLGGLVDHPNVVKVLGSGEQDGLPYHVLEHVPGMDLWRLTRWLARERRVLGIEIATHIARELLAALHAVHTAVDEAGKPLGLVHRDVSPSNVLVSMHGQLKLGDFGIARALLSESYPQASAGARGKGKLGYLSPEQVAGQATDRRADVFAAAVIAAELLMGKPLFSGSSELAVLLAIRDGDLHAFEHAAPTLPRPIAEAIRKGLVRDPDQRSPTARALSDLLEAAEIQLGHPQGDATARRAALAGIVLEAMRSRSTGSGLVPAQRGADDDSRTTDHPELVYRVRTSDGRALGPWTYARLVEAVTTSELGATDEVALGGEAFRPLRDLPDIFRHLPASSLDERTQRYATPAEPDHGYEVASGGVARGLAQVLLERDTGLLLFEQGSVRKEIYVVDGTPEFVSSNLASELLGEFLVARGVITRGELDMALAVMPRFDGRLGDTLTALGLVEPVHLFRQIASQVQEKLLELFTWTHGRGSFFRGVARPPSGFPLGLDPWRLLEEGIDRRLAARVEPELDDVTLLQSKRPAPRGLAAAPLSAFARQVLDRATRPTTYAALAALASEGTRRDPRRPRREISLLLAIGALAPASSS